MSEMGGMQMPGGWTMSMNWMLMPGQGWFAAVTSFLGMWSVMMVAMMLPSLIPKLQHYRQIVGSSKAAHLGRQTILVGAGYFFIWIVFGNGDIFVFGSANLSETFINDNLFDEYRIGIAPVLLGSGRPLFRQGISPRNLSLVSAQQLSTGGVVLRFTK